MTLVRRCSLQSGPTNDGAATRNLMTIPDLYIVDNGGNVVGVVTAPSIDSLAFDYSADYSGSATGLITRCSVRVCKQPMMS